MKFVQYIEMIMMIGAKAPSKKYKPFFGLQPKVFKMVAKKFIQKVPTTKLKKSFSDIKLDDEENFQIAIGREVLADNDIFTKVSDMMYADKKFMSTLEQLKELLTNAKTQKEKDSILKPYEN